MTIRCLVTATPESELPARNGTSARQFLLDALALASGSDVELVLNPADAELIIFAEWHGNEPWPDDVQRVLATAEYKQYGNKVVIHSGKDDPRPLIPGLYPSLSEGWCRILGCQGAPYLQPTNSFIGSELDWDGEVGLLAAFVGACEEKKIVRRRLLNQANVAKWRDISVRDTVVEFVGTIKRGDLAGHNALKKMFVLDLLNAKFALCPAGTGLSSFRVYEAMQAGRAPVVIADGWAAPPGPDWDSFSIRIPEADIQNLPAILRERESEWSVMGQKARDAWTQFYSPDKIGVTIVRQACQVLALANTQRALMFAARNIYVHGWRNALRLASRAVSKLRRKLAVASKKKP